MPPSGMENIHTSIVSGSNGLMATAAVAAPSGDAENASSLGVEGHADVRVLTESESRHEGMKNHQYRIVPEFKDLLPPLTPEQRATLKQLIKENGGCINALVVWDEQNILLDGHHRVEIMAELSTQGCVIQEPRIVRMATHSTQKARFGIPSRRTEKIGYLEGR